MKVNRNTPKNDPFFATKEKTSPKDTKYSPFSKLIKKTEVLHSNVKKLHTLEVKVHSSKEKNESLPLKKIIKSAKKFLACR